jgi:hypothetical protein
MAADIHDVGCDLKAVEEVAVDHRWGYLRARPANGHNQRTSKQVFCVLDGRRPRNDD